MNTREVYITKISKFLPNNPVSNDDMEDYLGLVKGSKSRSKNLILRNNGIKTRYYALDKNGNSTHTNAEIAAEAVKGLFTNGFQKEDIQLLTCGTGSPDQMVPSHASMIQGALKCNPIEVLTAGGTCNSGMLALKYSYMSILTGMVSNSVCVGSEKTSAWLRSENFEEEAEHLEKLGANPYIAFEREFLRWMLSDGASAVLLNDTPNKDGISLRIDWIENKSYANELKTCMYAGGIKNQSGELIPWREIPQKEQQEKSVFALQQDTKELEHTITKYGGIFLSEVCKKYNFKPSDIDFFLPHMSSEFFRKKIIEDSNKQGLPIADEKWFTNLHKVGNVGAASAFLMLEELFNEGRFKKGQKILIMVPESARFSYTYTFLTVV
ncbi:MAG: beta-ketoacyl-ACP synthase III [Bacteroidetes bacterium]|nr:beta-ketoacyl-ACP synthase III [Bacteroidota bacterium]